MRADATAAAGPAGGRSPARLESSAAAGIRCRLFRGYFEAVSPIAVASMASSALVRDSPATMPDATGML